MTTTVKTCFKCHTQKPLTEFYKHSRMGDGHLGKCKECTKSDTYTHRHVTHRDSVIAYDRARAKTPERIDAAKSIKQRWLERFSGWAVCLQGERLRADALGRGATLAATTNH